MIPFYYLYMKSLKESLFDSKTQTMESLFDRDLVTKEPIGNQLKNIVFFDGQLVYRIFQGSKRLIYTGDYVFNNALHIFDWDKVKKDLKKWKGDKIDLGLYAYANSTKYIMRTAETNKKTEDFARLIMSIPFTEEYHFGSFNSRFRDEFIPKLSEYILPRYKDFKPYMNQFYFDILTRSYGFSIVVRYGAMNPDRDPEVLRWEFLKLNSE